MNMRAQGRGQRFRPIFSGDNSKEMWKEIEAVPCTEASEALYSLGCLCQELEGIVSHLEARIAELESEKD